MAVLKQAIAEEAHESDSLSQLSNWWKATVALEREMDYVHSDPTTKAAWNDLVGRLMLEPSKPLYLELAECVRLWRTRRMRLAPRWHTLLDAYLATAWGEGLCLADHAMLVALQLRKRLEAAPCGV